MSTNGKFDREIKSTALFTRALQKWGKKVKKTKPKKTNPELKPKCYIVLYANVYIQTVRESTSVAQDPVLTADNRDAHCCSVELNFLCVCVLTAGRCWSGISNVTQKLNKFRSSEQL